MGNEKPRAMVWNTVTSVNFYLFQKIKIKIKSNGHNKKMASQETCGNKKMASQETCGNNYPVEKRDNSHQKMASQETCRNNYRVERGIIAIKKMVLQETCGKVTRRDVIWDTFITGEREKRWGNENHLTKSRDKNKVEKRGLKGTTHIKQ